MGGRLAATHPVQRVGRLVTGLAVLLAGAPARAQLDEELEALALPAPLAPDEAAALQALLTGGLRLERATAEELAALPGLGPADVEALLAYRSAGGPVSSPEALVHAGVWDARTLEAVAPFLAAPRAPGTWSGALRASTRAAPSDTVSPPTAVRARLETPGGLDAGLALALTRRELTAARFEPERRLLWAHGPAPRLRLPRAWARLERGRLELLAGTFRARFAEGLVVGGAQRPGTDGFLPEDDVRLDALRTQPRCLVAPSSARPAGAACAPGAPTVPLSGDPTWDPAHRGVAASVRGVSLGRAAWLGAHVFASVQGDTLARSALEVGCAHGCSAQDAGCARSCSAQDAGCGRGCSPPSLRLLEGDGATLTAGRLGGVRERWSAGAHATLQVGPAVRLGVTGAAETRRWRVGDGLLTARDAPAGGAGVVGATGRLEAGRLTLALELARARAGWAAVQRSLVRTGRASMELTLHARDAHFASPLATAALQGPGAQAGARLRAALQPARAWRLRADADAVRPAEAPGRWRTRAGADLDTGATLAPGAWVELASTARPRDACDAADAEEDCDGLAARAAAGARLTWRPVRVLAARLQLQRRLAPGSDAASAALQLDVRAASALQLRARATATREDAPAALAGTASLQARVRASRHLALALRWDARAAWGPTPTLPFHTGTLSLEVTHR